jgi:predicted nucleotidyltransferase
MRVAESQVNVTRASPAHVVTSSGSMHAPAVFLRPRLDPAAIERLRAAAGRVFAPHPAVAAVYLYGSGARGEPLADLDIAVLTEHGATVGSLEALAAALQAEGAPQGPDIDMRHLRGTGPRFRANVIGEGRLIFERSRAARIAFEAESISEWLDFKPTWQRMRVQMLDRWIHG